MNPAKYSEIDDINFLIGAQLSYSCVEASKVHPREPNPPAHDAITRLLHRHSPDPGKLWNESKPLVDDTCGVLVLDDSTLDKPYAKKMELVTRHWSGKHLRVVRGINLITLLWPDGDRHVPKP